MRGQPTLHREIACYFDDPAAKCQTHTDNDKGHGRIETRRCHVTTTRRWADIDPGDRLTHRGAAQDDPATGRRRRLRAAAGTSSRLQDVRQIHRGML